MKRLLIDFKKLDAEVAGLLLSAYPDGYGDDDIIAFKNAKGEIIQAVELRTDDILYLIKISTDVSHFIAYMEEESERQEEVGMEADSPEMEMDLEAELDEEADQDF